MEKVKPRKRMTLAEMEEKIREQYPTVRIVATESANQGFSLSVLGIEEAPNGENCDFVEWAFDGRAWCYFKSSSFRCVTWDEDEQQPKYIHPLTAWRNERYDLR